MPRCYRRLMHQMLRRGPGTSSLFTVTAFVVTIAVNVVIR